MATKPAKPLQPVLAPHGSQAAPWKLGDVLAVQALSRGQADEEQQRIAWKWILEEACGLPIWAYRSGADGARETDIALGRQFVGQQLIGALKLNISAMKKREI